MDPTPPTPNTPTESLVKEVVCEHLITELLRDPPVENCADNGNSCVFCYRPFRHRHPSRGGTGIIHTPDCWLVRASRVLGVEPPPHATKNQ